MFNRLVAAAFCFCLTTSAFGRPAAATKRGITEKDLFDFVWIGAPEVSPDGSQVVYVRVTVNAKKDGYDTAIWLVSTSGNQPTRQLTGGTHDATPRWSPDGRWLVFTRATEKDGKKQPAQLCLLPMNGGDAFVFTDLPKGAGDPKWSPDGKSILFTSTSNPKDLAKQARARVVEEERKRAALAQGSPASPNEKKKAEEAGEEEHESDVHVITRAVYRNDEEGCLDFTRPTHLWVVGVPRSAEQ